MLTVQEPNLQEAMLLNLVGSLQRSAINKCSKWALKYRVMGPPFSGPWTFTYHPWLKAMMDSEASKNVGRKAAQMGFTEACLNRALYQIDIHQRSVLYILPSHRPDATDFSSSRFDVALELSEHLQKIFQDVKNVGHKRAGAASLYIRGSKSRAGVKSIPAAVLFFDERDEMNQKNIPLARERSSGQTYTQDWDISTPTAPGFGIDEDYQASNKQRFCFKCPLCFRWTDFDEDSLIITADNINDPKIKNSYMQCRECKGRLEHSQKHIFLQKNEWKAENSNDVAGWWIPQFYSSSKAASPNELAIHKLHSLENEYYAQEWHNSKLGKPYAPKGAKISDEQITACIRDYKQFEISSKSNSRICTMGVDVGKWLHVEIIEWLLEKDSLITPDLNMYCKARLISEQKVASFNNLDDLMRQYQINMCVIDANPERRQAHEFSMRFPGFVKLCFYASGIGNKNIHIDKIEGNKVSVDRTSWLDLSLGRFKNQRILLPRDLSQEYIRHIKDPVKIYKLDQNNNPIGVYLGKEDHYAHARCYSEIALPLAASMASNQDVSNFL